MTESVQSELLGPSRPGSGPEGDHRPAHLQHPLSDPPPKLDEDSQDSRDMERGPNVGGSSREDLNNNSEKADPNLVEWTGPDDPENPQNWRFGKKAASTFLYAMMTVCVTFASTVFSEATAVTAKKYRVGTEVTTLGTSLFVLVRTPFSRQLRPVS